MAFYTDYGIVAMLCIVVVGYWLARKAASIVMATILASAVGIVASYLVNSVIKNLVKEVRPCHTLSAAHTVLACDPLNDYSFPSNHSVVAGAIAAGAFFIKKILGIIASIAAFFIGFSRVYVGAHYPHDVLAGWLVGILVTMVVVFVLRNVLVGFIRMLKRTALRPLVSAH
jgi:undecaprenyl-diphosphatase